MHIGVIGSGYVGLVVGTCLADSGNQVICYDIDKEKVQLLQGGKIGFYEQGLEAVFQRNVQNDRLTFSNDLAQLIDQSEIFYIAVGTPPEDDGTADLSAVYATVDGIGNALGKSKDRKIVVIKSTVPVGTWQKVKERLIALSSAEIAVVSNPEFLKQGSAVEDFTKPDRIILGAEEEWALQIMKTLYEPFVRTGNPILVMDNASAELTKYAANGMLATRISLMNEIANFCEQIGGNIDKVRIGLATDRRIGKAFLFPGVGYGGSCFPKDVRALISQGESIGTPMRVLQSTHEVNEDQQGLFFPRILQYFDNDLRDKKFALWGLAFKPNTSDMRGAPSRVMIKLLLEAGATVAAHDPEAEESAREIFGNAIAYHSDSYDVVRGADALILMTEWNEFRRPNFRKIQKLMRGRVIFDGRNIFDQAEVIAMGFDYYGVGRRRFSSSPKEL